MDFNASNVIITFYINQKSKTENFRKNGEKAKEVTKNVEKAIAVMLQCS